jgi:predicted SAM-dependent methyltransferase
MNMTEMSKAPLHSSNSPVVANWPSQLPDTIAKQPPVVLDDPRPWGRPLFERLGLRGLHCGCGPRLQSGWLNTDRSALPSPDGQPTAVDRLLRLAGDFYYLRHDAATAFPLDDGSFEWVYSEHFIEHIGRREAGAWLREVRRLLAPGGVARITTPDLRRYVEGYLDPEGRFFAEHARRLRNIGVKNIPDSRAWMVNQIFYGWGHRWLYDFEELRAAALEAGFAAGGVIQTAFASGKVPSMAALDQAHRSDETLYVELVA